MIIIISKKGGKMYFKKELSELINKLDEIKGVEVEALERWVKDGKKILNNETRERNWWLNVDNKK